MTTSMKSKNIKLGDGLLRIVHVFGFEFSAAGWYGGQRTVMGIQRTFIGFSGHVMSLAPPSV